jgi:hypothetical protein
MAYNEREICHLTFHCGLALAFGCSLRRLP